MIRNWIKVFVYHLKQNRLFSALNILGLAMGISAVIFAILYWNDEHSYNQWNPEKNKIYQVVNDLGDDTKWPYNVAPLAAHLKQDAPAVQSFCYASVGYQKQLVSYAGKKRLVDKIMNSQRNFFSFFPFAFVEGTAASALADASSVAIEQSMARQLFGNGEHVGKQLYISKKLFTVRGVYRIPGNSSVAPEIVYANLDQNLKSDQDQWGNFSYSLWLKIDDPALADDAARQIEQIFIENRSRKYAQKEGISLEEFVKKNGYIKIILERLDEVRLHSIVDGMPEGNGNYRFLLIMAGLSVLILILSVVNYINLATAGAIKRAKEVGVRRIIGATRTNIVWQFLTETVFITAFSILLALAIVELSLPYYNEFLSKQLLMSGSQFWVQLVGIFAAVLFCAGIFPALYVSNFETLKVLRGNFGRSRSGVWLRNAMLVLQFSIATFFIIGSYVVREQVHYMASKDLGFSGSQVLDITYRNDYDWNKPSYKKDLLNRYQLLKRELLKMPGVKMVAGGAVHFGEGATSSSGFTYNDANVQAQNIAVDFDFLDMMKVKMVRGRQLSAKYASDSVSSVLINETAQRLMKEKNPIGKEIRWNNYNFKIVGVVQDFHINGLQQEIPPMIFMNHVTVDWMLGNMKNVFVTIDPEYLQQTLGEIERIWVRNVDRDYPFAYDFVDKAYARTYEQYVKQENLFSLLNVVVIVIALFGLFALASFSIERRMKEIAIRKTLGAETASLLRELSKQYLLFCAIGFAIAFFPTRIILNKWLEEFAYRVNVEILPFFVGLLVLSCLTLGVVLAKAYRATRVDVLQYLKYE